MFTEGLWPAARAIWREGFGGGQLAPLAVRREDARWVDGRLTAAGLAPLPLAQLVAKAHELGLVTGAIVHTFNRWQWAEAEFALTGGRRSGCRSMALALRWGAAAAAAATAERLTGQRLRMHRTPPRLLSAGAAQQRRRRLLRTIGTLAEVAVDTASGEVELLNHHSILECGNQIVPELVSGQLQGGLAMGIGHALHEYLPLYEDGPGNGTWNFNRYTLPRAERCRGVAADR